MSLNMDSLRRAIASYERAIHVIDMRMKDADESELEVLRAGLIQNFEFTYELSWKFMKRWIETNIQQDLVTGVPRIELFRRAAESKLIDDVMQWMVYHKARNRTSHIYDEDTSLEVYEVAKEFFEDVKRFAAILEKANV